MDAQIFHCDDCGIDRPLIGFLYPCRLLCNCTWEKDLVCSICKEPALVLEFEGDLEGKSTSFCRTHSPCELDEESTAQDEFDFFEDEGFEPNLDPIYHRNGIPAPPSSLSKRKVCCYDCYDVHALRDRVRWNGSCSYCPMCDSDMVDYEPEKEDYVLSDYLIKKGLTAEDRLKITRRDAVKRTEMLINGN